MCYPQARLDESFAVALDDCRFIFGHFSHDDIIKYFSDRKILTVLRDPVDRCVSWYYYARAAQVGPFHEDVTAAQNLSIDDFFSLSSSILSRNVSNQMTRQLGAHALDKEYDRVRSINNAILLLQQCEWIGLHERLDDHIRELSRILGIDMQLPRENVTKERLSVSAVGGHTRDKIVAMNQDDISLYKRVVSDR